MRKAPAGGLDSGAGRLRSIPSVERILCTPLFVNLTSQFSRERVKQALVAHLGSLRQSGGPWDEGEAVAETRERLSASVSSTLRRVINATGVIIHTNLGRSPIDPGVWADAGTLVSGYSNLEFDLESGERGTRDAHLSAICASLFGCEAAVLTNNNAAGTLLLLAAVAAKKEVIV